MIKAESSESLDRRSVIPLYFQLQEILKERIELGVWSTDMAIPAEGELCDTFAVSRTVVRQALAILEQDRQIVRVRGRGTFVAAPKIEQRAGGLGRLLASPTPDARISILDVRKQQSSRRISRQLGLKAGSSILRIMSLLHVRDAPTALIDSFFAADDSGDLRELRPTKVPVTLSSLQWHGPRLTNSAVTIETSFCSRWEAEQLGLPFRGAVFVTLVTEYRASETPDVPFEVARAVYRADLVQFRLDLSNGSSIPQATWELSEATR